MHWIESIVYHKSCYIKGRAISGLVLLAVPVNKNKIMFTQKKEIHDISCYAQVYRPIQVYLVVVLFIDVDVSVETKWCMYYYNSQ